MSTEKNNRMSTMTYKEKKSADDFKKAKAILKKLPSYCEAYYSSIRNKSGGTVHVYMRDIFDFYMYLYENNPELHQKGIKNISLDDIANLTRQDIEDFLSELYNKNYGDCDVAKQNNTKRIYISALTSFFKFWEDEEIIEKNVMSKITKNKKERKRHVVRLEDYEETGLLDSVLYGTGLTKKQAAACKNTRLRDYAICITLLRTGIRVSELVGLNVEDINFKKNSFLVARKESMKKDDEVYYDDDVASALYAYLEEREALNAERGTPVFIVSQGKYKGDRLSVRTVENLVYKYSAAGAGRRVSPHKLRATFATNMITATGNIELVKVQMGHADISTTTTYIDDNAIAKANARNILKERRDAINSGLLDPTVIKIEKK